MAGAMNAEAKLPVVVLGAGMVGVACALAASLGKPVIGIHHLEGGFEWPGGGNREQAGEGKRSPAQEGEEAVGHALPYRGCALKTV